jgi:Chaperone of endosialidase
MFQRIFGRVKEKVGFAPTLGSPLNGITKQTNKKPKKNMKTLIKLKTTTLLVIPLVLACFALLPSAQAFTTDPDDTFANFNTAAGFEALLHTTGASNTGFGIRALRANTTGGSNLGIGGFALINNIDGDSNTAVGNNAMFSNQHGDSNMALGQGALGHNVSGNDNVAMGAQALAGNTASSNTAVGFQAMAANTSNSFSTALGFQALSSITAAGTGSTAIGYLALLNATSTIGDNTALGDTAGQFVTTGAHNIIIGGFGSGRGANITVGSNIISIGTQGANVDSSCYIGRISSSNYFSIFQTPVYIDTNTQRLHVNFSSQRFKHEIKPMDKASEAILALKPVTFHYKNDAPGTPQSYGLIAEDVAKVNPDLVVPDGDGKPLAIHYESINAMLLNEFLKEHKKVEAQQASIADLKSTVALQKKEMEVLTAQLKEQAAQIQKVSAQVETIKPAPKVVANQ